MLDEFVEWLRLQRSQVTSTTGSSWEKLYRVAYF